MKTFRFPLDRVLGWRRTLVQIEQVKLERLLGERNTFESRLGSIRGERESAQYALLKAPSTLGQELAAFEAYSKASINQADALRKAIPPCLEKIRAQRLVLQSKERDVRLLESLRQDRWQEWNREQNKEIDHQAEESHLARWRSGT